MCFFIQTKLLPPPTAAARSPVRWETHSTGFPIARLPITIPPSNTLPPTCHPIKRFSLPLLSRGELNKHALVLVDISNCFFASPSTKGPNNAGVPRVLTCRLVKTHASSSISLSFPYRNRGAETGLFWLFSETKPFIFLIQWKFRGRKER
jgi:hypothetical protein